MNNDEKILSTLETINGRLERLEGKVDAIKAEQTEMKGTLDAVFQQTANLTESRPPSRKLSTTFAL